MVLHFERVTKGLSARLPGLSGLPGSDTDTNEHETHRLKHTVMHGHRCTNTQTHGQKPTQTAIGIQTLTQTKLHTLSPRIVLRETNTYTIAQTHRPSQRRTVRQAHTQN